MGRQREGESLSLSHTQKEKKFNQQIFLVSQLDSGLRKAFIWKGQRLHLKFAKIMLSSISMSEQFEQFEIVVFGL